MNTVAIFLLLSCFSLFGAQPEITAHYMVEGNFHDVAILWGKESDPSGPITLTLREMLCQKQFPIIVYKDIFKNFIENNYNPLNSNPVPFIDDEWFMYASTQPVEDFFLLVPKQYYERQAKKFPIFKHAIGVKIGKEQFSYSRNELITGFATDHLDICKRTYMRNYKPGLPGFDALKKTITVEPTKATFSRLFVRGKDNIFGLWNIYMSGHGFYPTIDLDKPLPKIIEENAHMNSQIVGLPLNEFRSVIQLLITKISTNFLYYYSCYAGDVNLILPYITYIINNKRNIIGNLKKPNFIFAAGSLTSETVAIPITTTCQDVTTFRDFISFFNTLHLFTNPLANRPTIFKDKELIKILEPISKTADDEFWKKVYPYLGEYVKIAAEISSFPQIFFPQVAVPKALALTDDISVITKTLVTTYLLEKKPIKLDNKSAILLYPENIGIALHVSSKEDKPFALVSMLPGVGLHHIKNIDTNLSWQKLCYCFGFVNPKFKKYFFIDQISYDHSGTKNTIHNVLVLNNEEGSTVIFADSNKIIQKFSVIGSWGYKAVQEPKKQYLGTIFKDIIPNNTLANAVINYRLLPTSKLDFDAVFDWKALSSILGKEDKGLIEKALRPALAPTLKPSPKLSEAAKSSVKPAEKPSLKKNVVGMIPPLARLTHENYPTIQSLQDLKEQKNKMLSLANEEQQKILQEQIVEIDKEMKKRKAVTVKPSVSYKPATARQTTISRKQ
ncbi:MAG TPA: hypothetical protein VFF04_04020 [Candidatus Babeliales bacterium]|nr:hypothetical protein [Candidatus Babeliales bacterium]